MTIHCITFDLDDTLWECKPIIKRAEHQLLEWLQINYPRITQAYSPEQLATHRMEFMKAHPELHHNLSQIRKDWLALMAQEFDYEGDVLRDEGFQVFWKARNDVVFLEGVLDLLTALKEDYIIGAITNGNADLHHIGVGHLFDFSIKSEDVGVAKPHPDIFQVAVDKAGVDAEQILHVGDDPMGDIKGAQAAGMKTLWANYARKPWQEVHQPDAVIHEVGELTEAIGVLK